MSTSLYSIRFQHTQIEIPYTNIIINIFSPWTYFISFGSCLLYLILIVSIFPLFKSKFKGSFAKIHFTLLFLYSFFVFISVLFHLIVSREIINWSNFMCTQTPSWLRIISISFTLSKLYEWLDTAILISKGQSLAKIGFLHIYHHATTFLLFLCITNFPGPEKTGMLLNGFVHTLMYYHFAFRLPKLLRPLITTIQILQLIAVTYIWLIVPTSCSSYQHFPSQNVLEFTIPYALVPIYCLFFFKFFVEQYILSSSKKVKSTSRKDE